MTYEDNQVKRPRAVARTSPRFGQRRRRWKVENLKNRAVNKPEEQSLSNSSMKEVRVGDYTREVQATIWHISTCSYWWQNLFTWLIAGTICAVWRISSSLASEKFETPIDLTLPKYRWKSHVHEAQAERLFTNPFSKPPPFVSRYLAISIRVGRRVFHPDGLASRDDCRLDSSR